MTDEIEVAGRVIEVTGTGGIGILRVNYLVIETEKGVFKVPVKDPRRYLLGQDVKIYVCINSSRKV